MKVLITGGHLGPALSVIEALSKDTDIVFVGRKHALEGDLALSLEYQTIISRNIKFIPITTGRIQRAFTKHTLSSVLKLPRGFFQAFGILREEHPDIVVGFGGYVSFPIAVAAFFMNIPVVIHEQTLDAGISNRIIALFAKKICISWETSRKYYPAFKTVLTGNPIRNFTLSDTGFKYNHEKPLIYITGGSLGSHYINTLVEGSLYKLLENYSVIHQTGDAQRYKDYERLTKLRNSLPENLKRRYTLVKFIDPSETGNIFQISDLVISRGGINTITELLFFKKPSLLMPLLVSQGGEQRKNAFFLQDKGMARLLPHRKDFFDEITGMFADMDKYKKNGLKLGNLVKVDAAKKIVEVIELCSKRKTEKAESR